MPFRSLDPKWGAGFWPLAWANDSGEQDKNTELGTKTGTAWRPLIYNSPATGSGHKSLPYWARGEGMLRLTHGPSLAKRAVPAAPRVPSDPYRPCDNAEGAAPIVSLPFAGRPRLPVGAQLFSAVCNATQCFSTKAVSALTPFKSFCRWIHVCKS